MSTSPHFGTMAPTATFTARPKPPEGLLARMATVTTPKSKPVVTPALVAAAEAKMWPTFGKRK